MGQSGAMHSNENVRIPGDLQLIREAHRSARIKHYIQVRAPTSYRDKPFIVDTSGDVAVIFSELSNQFVLIQDASVPRFACQKCDSDFSISFSMQRNVQTMQQVFGERLNETTSFTTIYLCE